MDISNLISIAIALFTLLVLLLKMVWDEWWKPRRDLIMRAETSEHVTEFGDSDMWLIRVSFINPASVRRTVSNMNFNFPGDHRLIWVRPKLNALEGLFRFSIREFGGEGVDVPVPDTLIPPHHPVDILPNASQNRWIAIRVRHLNHENLETEIIPPFLLCARDHKDKILAQAKVTLVKGVQAPLDSLAE